MVRHLPVVSNNSGEHHVHGSPLTHALNSHPELLATRNIQIVTPVQWGRHKELSSYQTVDTRVDEIMSNVLTHSGGLLFYWPIV